MSCFPGLRVVRENAKTKREPEDSSGIFEDTARVLWLSLGFGVLSYDPQTGKTAHYPGAISTFVQGGAQGRVWVGTVEGLKQLNPEGTAVVDVQVGGNGGGGNVDHVRVEAAAEDDTSHLLIGTLGRGVYRAEIGRAHV